MDTKHCFTTDPDTTSPTLFVSSQPFQEPQKTCRKTDQHTTEHHQTKTNTRRLHQKKNPNQFLLTLPKVTCWKIADQN